jgi:hypothetical protein
VADPWVKYANMGAVSAEEGPWARYGGGSQAAQNSAATPPTSTPAQEPVERPGFFKRFAQTFGLPTTKDEAGGMIGLLAPPREDELQYGPGTLQFKRIVGGIAQAIGDKAKSAGSEAREALQNVGRGGDIGPNAAKVAFAALPDIAQGYGEDINSGNYRGALGTATGVMSQAALAKLPATKLPEALGKIKSGLTVSDELKAAAAQVPAEHVPDAALARAAKRTAGEIHQAAVPELSDTVGKHIDQVAAQLGVDTTGAASLSTKAELAGRGAKTAGQKLYQQLDQAAAETAGAPGGNFQRYAKTVQQLERESLDPALTATQQEAVAERLNNARAEFDAFKQEMVKRGLSESTIKQADRFWAQGSALDELSRGLLNSEDAFGRIKPSARPLDATVKKLTAPASGRGHILKQAVGDNAEAISAAARKAQEKIVADKAATAAAKDSLAASKQAAKTAQKAVQDSAAQAQKRIDTIKGRQKAIAKGAAGALGLGVAYKYGGDVRDVLSGR